MAELQRRGGSGEPMVLVHGFSGTWRGWEPVLPALRAQHNVLAVALLGHSEGEDFAEDVAPAFSSLVEGVERDMDAAGMETAHVVGNSLGGWIALELGRRGRARTVVALSPAGGWTAGSAEERRLNRYFTATRRALRLVGPERAARLARRPRFRAIALRDIVAHPRRVAPAAAEAMIRGSAECAAYEALLEAIGREGPPTDLSGIECPVRIAWGTRDRILPVARYSARLRELVPEAEFVELPGLGHVPMSDDPALVARTILEVSARGEAPTAPDAAALR